MQRYNIRFSKQVDKFLQKHPEVIKRFFACVDKISINPYDTQLDIKPLQGVKNHWRLRIGKWRFLYEVEDPIILIYMYDADTRGDIYAQKK